ncbi:MAG: hypothetical protein ACOX1Y_10590 [Zhaonellaceae bacterium]
MFSEAGTYTVTVEFKEVGTGDVLATHVMEVTVEAYVPMEVTSDVPTFKVGEQQEFTVSTKANDDAGRMVRAYFNIPDEATVEYYEVKDGNWYALGNEYGPTEGFPVADATSKFRAVFSEAGTYTVTVEFKEVGTGEVVATHELEVTVEEPVASTYKFSYEVPADVVAGQEVEVPVTFETDGQPGDIGYDGVRFKFAAEGPEGATVTFKAVDSNNDEYTFTNEGYWGPPGGFDLPAQYSATTEWTLVFSKAGDYTITFSLIDAATEEVTRGHYRLGHGEGGSRDGADRQCG